MLTANEYKEIIDSFDVENNPKYQNDEYTYCNVFAYDVSVACETPLPYGTCAYMLSHLTGNNWPDWYSVDFLNAQQRANMGRPTIAITSSHVAVVRPSESEIDPDTFTKRDVCITQAGRSLLAASTLNYGWSPSTEEWNEIRFYSWYYPSEL